MMSFTPYFLSSMAIQKVTIQKSTLLLLGALSVSAANVQAVIAAPTANLEVQSSELELALETLPTTHEANESAPAFALEFQTEEWVVEAESTISSPNQAPVFETLVASEPVISEEFVAVDNDDILNNALSAEAIGEIEYETLAQFEDDVADNETPKFGQAGKQRWYVQGAVASDLDDDLFGLVGAGVTHFFYDYHSLSLELNGLAFSQPGPDAAGLNLGLILRSHWIRGDKWTLYVDGGAGIIVTTDEVPAVGSSFNFTPQIGGGATFDIGNNNRIMTGLRWHHISNANLYESNPGLDAWFGYVGVNFPL